MGDIFVRLVQLPTLRTYGLTQVDENHDYNVYIDERLSDETRLRTFLHELRHITCGHFRDGITATEAENEVEE